MALATATLLDRKRFQMSRPWLTGGAVGATSSSAMIGSEVDIYRTLTLGSSAA